MNGIKRLQQALSSSLDWLKPTPAALSGAADGIAALGLVVVFIYLLLVGVADFAPQKIPALVIWVLVPAAIGCGLFYGAAALNALPSKLRITLCLVSPLLMLFVFPGSTTTGLIMGGLALLSFGLVGAGSGVLLQSDQSVSRRYAAKVYLCFGVLILSAGLYAVFSQKEAANPALANYQLEDLTLNLPNPSLKGAYNVKTLSYGSGKDLRRSEFGKNVTLTARSVDGSKLIENWSGLSGWLRTSYWGFSVDELPLQARVWLPDGVGPFPLVLVVHGNHSMEDFSDPGYDYLGELLASRGIILASVDENFINSSYSARVDFLANRPGLKEENDARAWLLLEHLNQWRDWNSEEGHSFYGMIDMDKLALIGHSRGGEAVGIAAAFNELSHYPDDASMEFDFNFNLKGVIAIAPVYGQYQPRNRPTPVKDVNYFTIHGDMDGDVQSFEGAAQYSRVGFTGEEFKFRSSLYVVGANHGQFNTTWENLDTGKFSAWALDLERIMAPEAQRAVAKVYFSAFLETVFNGDDRYIPMFKDARFAAAWLPNTFYINQYSDSNERAIVDFEDDLDLTTIDKNRGRIETENMTRWYEMANRLKYDELDTHSVVLAWDQEVTGAESLPSISFLLGNTFTGTGNQSLVLSLSVIDQSTKPTDWTDVDANDDSGELAEPTDEPVSELLDWTVELTDAAGNVATLPLSYDSHLYPLIKAVPRRASFLDDTAATEILFRRFELPLSEFSSVSETFNKNWLSKIRFVFDRSQKGAIIMDNIALSIN